MQRFLLFACAGLSLAACAESKPRSKPVTVPPPVAKPTPQPAPAPKPAIVQPTGHWLDWPMAPGSWVYRKDDRGSIALFGPTGADALVALRCDTTRHSLYLSRAGLAGSQMIVRTSSISKTLPLQPTGGQPPYVATALTPADPTLDALAFSRGRIAIEVDGAQNIAIPVWSEIGRVVEDCRS